MGVKEGVDPRKLEESGWGVIFSELGKEDANRQREQEAIQEALAPLLALRQSQAGPRYRQYDRGQGVRPGDSKFDFLRRLGMGPGPADPDRVPYYLLLVGDPETIPYRFQVALDVQYAVGRIHFDALEEYAQYAASVVMAETGQVALPRTAAFFGVENQGDPMTQVGLSQLVSPLAQALTQNASRWDIRTFLRDAASKVQLDSLLGGNQTPALLFASAHGMGFPNGDPRQLPHQGALLCQDWPGPQQWRRPIPQEFYFAGDDMRADASLLGSIAMLHASYSAGRASNWGLQRRPPTKARPGRTETSALAYLPQKLLGHARGGMLAVVGWIEQLWGASAQWPQAAAQLAVFEAVLRRLMDGYPIGSALEHLSERYAELATELGDYQEEIKSGVVVDPWKLAGVWAYTNEAQRHVLIGDPAVRLLVVDDHAVEPRPVLAEVKPSSGAPPVSAAPDELTAYQQQLRQALDATATDETPGSLPRLVQSALELARSLEATVTEVAPFQEASWLTVLALRASAGAQGARETLHVHLQRTWDETGQIAASGRWRDDLHGRYLRLLPLYAQLAARALVNQDLSPAEMLSRALELPRGSASVAALANLALAEAVLICRPPQEAEWTEQALWAARIAAHNMADPPSLARTTARVDAIRSQWWPAPILDLQERVRVLKSEPPSALLAALHTVGQVYEDRDSAFDHTPEWDQLIQANTLAALAEVYQRSLTDLQRLNPELDPSQPLSRGTIVHIPDPELAPLLAARLAAEALAVPDLADSERSTLIRSLVVVAAADLTALDTVLSRLLLAEAPRDPALLDALSALLPPVDTVQPPAEEVRLEDAPTLAQRLASEAKGKLLSHLQDEAALGALLAIEALKRAPAALETQQAWSHVQSYFPPSRTSLAWDPARRLSNNLRAPLALSHDGRRAAVLNGRGLEVYDLKTGKLLWTLKVGIDKIRAVSLGPDGVVLATADAEGTVRLWDIKQRRVLATLAGTSQGNIQALGFSADGKRLAAGLGSGALQVWDMDNQQLITVLSHVGDVIDAVLNHDGSWLATTWYHPQLEENAAKVWTVSQEPGKGGYVDVGGYIKGDVTAAALSADGNLLATGGYDRGVELWNLRSQAAIEQGDRPPTREWLARRESTSPITGLALNPDGSLLAIATDSGVAIWNYETQQLVAAVDHGSARLLAFAEDDQRLMTVGETGAHTWDLVYGRELAMHLQRSSHPPTDQEAIQREIAEVCQRVGRSLTAEEWRTYLGEDEPYNPACAEFVGATSPPNGSPSSQAVA